MKRDSLYLKGNQHAAGAGPNKTSFPKGNVPWNKGKKGIHLSPASEFKKGCKSLKSLLVGTVTVRIDKGGKRRQWIKTGEPSHWTEYAKFVWIFQNGPIPKGMLVHHLDFDSMNDDLDNLSIVTRKAHFEIHGIGAMGRAAKSS